MFNDRKIFKLIFHFLIQRILHTVKDQAYSSEPKHTMNAFLTFLFPFCICQRYFYYTYITLYMLQVKHFIENKTRTMIIIVHRFSHNNTFIIIIIINQIKYVFLDRYFYYFHPYIFYFLSFPFQITHLMQSLCVLSAIILSFILIVRQRSLIMPYYTYFFFYFKHNFDKATRN